MAENNNQNNNGNQDPFGHPIKNNNWWLYILGGLVIVGIIIWFFVDWSYKDREREPAPVEQTMEVPVQDQAQEETLPAVTVEGNDSLPQE
ncbi:MAG: hypothetical protein J1E95_00790 [Muribaculaceae bacterium]|nr:hypothetical protein [Muribaculaceae bacterium]